jgi:hypothetical protein
MKKITGCLLLLTIFVVQQSCNKRLDEINASYVPLNPANIDLNAGTWKPILLAAPDEFPLTAPVASSSPGYVAELNEIKSWQQHITPQQRQLIQYWSAGSVLRWNEILRELVAKHNLPPYQNGDGTYPAPSAANPFAYPVFPFSNPPYAARAYAYVSAAQYDALVAAWHYKKLYNRAAPYKIDSSSMP